MNKTLRTLIVAASFLLSGIVICFIALTGLDFDFSSLNTVDLIEKKYDVNEAFVNINIDSAEGDIKVLPSDDGKCSIVCFDDGKIHHTVEVRGSTLYVKRIDSRKWYEHIGIYWATMRVTVYLPQDKYEDAVVKSVSGDVFVSPDISFDDLSLISTSGDISFDGKARHDLVAKTVSGDIRLSNVDATTLSANTTSGDIDLGHVDITDGAVLKTVSGDVEMISCDAGSFEIRTVSGDVEGSIASSKNYIVSTTSGDKRCQSRIRAQVTVLSAPSAAISK
jgi:DUF4097 and DUF4098 domain-containing protein YvlB